MSPRGFMHKQCNPSTGRQGHPLTHTNARATRRRLRRDGSCSPDVWELQPQCGGHAPDCHSTSPSARPQCHSTSPSGAKIPFIWLFGGSCGLTPRRIASQQCTQVPHSATGDSRKDALWGCHSHGKAHFACETRPKGAFCMRAVVAPRGRFRRSVYTPAYPRPLSRPGGSTGPTTSRTHGPRDAKVPGPEAHATGAVTQPSTHTNSRSLILFAHLPVLAPLDASEWQADRKRLRNSSVALQMSGSPGRIRTCDTLINSQLRYHCATGECCHAPAHGHLLYQNSDRMQGHSSAPYKRAAHIHLRCP